MKLRITFYAEPRDVHPLILANPTGDFESLESARKSAFEDADRPTMQAHSIIIATVETLRLRSIGRAMARVTGRAANKPLIAGFAGKTSALVDHLVSAREQRRLDVEAECFAVLSCSPAP